MPEKEAPSGNEDYSWSQFDSEAYFQHYYGEPHPDDDLVIDRVCRTISRLAPPDGWPKTVDVGTGPNLYPLMCMLPFSRHLTAWEYSTSNVDWIERELTAETVRPQWQHFWSVVRDAYGEPLPLPADPMPSLSDRAHVRNSSIFELPEREWDAATMFFCAESITERHDQFAEACRRFARCVRPGGTLLAAFLVGSSAYAVSGRPFPVLKLSAGDIREAFTGLASNVTTEPIGIVEKEIRSGYSGMLFLSATAA